MSISKGFTNQSAYPNQITTTGAECANSTAHIVLDGVNRGLIGMISSLGLPVDALNNAPKLVGLDKINDNQILGYDHISEKLSELYERYVCTPNMRDEDDVMVSSIVKMGTMYLLPVGAASAALSGVSGFVKAGVVMNGADAYMTSIELAEGGEEVIQTAQNSMGFGL